MAKLKASFILVTAWNPPLQRRGMALRCFVSQSTLSKGIPKPEELIGCPLYEKKDKSPSGFYLAGEQV